MLLLGACHTTVTAPALEDLEWEQHSAEDFGSLCLIVAGEDPRSVLQQPPPAQTFVPGVPLVAVHGLCFSPYCDRGVELTLEADGLDFTTSADWEEPVPVEGLYCPLPCDIHFATLDLDPLPEGSHTVTFAGDSLTLEVPGTQRACLGTHPFGAARKYSQ